MAVTLLISAFVTLGLLLMGLVYLLDDRVPVSDEEKYQVLRKIQIEKELPPRYNDEYKVLEIVDNNIAPKVILKRLRDGYMVSSIFVGQNVNVGDIMKIVLIRNTTSELGNTQLITVAIKK
ncbi:hypothetical protein A3I18_01965 [Candidatus Campbellbacteria bacterium RIFCSPLOWO2_02_FULL_35_11]|uniref:Uncharacterized protein n=1 Tax=Candidatus Campbellbacteria bacterium RIFCSPLOWO2_02_FULL_35_11 TaxID=1797581 RepID=A0A1F5ES94_9BACT|nr:MAG: hypothetical protein A3I18_01965 [Candidatus Campbellbacteria bacterium RIFCSPLOWO2_02_FULL_35_11]